MSSMPKSLIIRKSNALIEASHKLSISEQRLLILLASTITPDDEDFKEYELTVSKYAEMFKIDLNEFNKSLYGTLETAVDSLMKQQISFKNGEEIIKRQWVSVSRYIPNSGVVRLKFDADLKPYFLQLKDRFTQYHVEHIVSFRGQYSPRLYELLKAEAYKAKKGLFERFFQIDDLRFILGVNLNSYPVFNDFKLYVINPSINEISLSSDLMINEVRYGKTGRKITNVTFLVEVLSKDQTNSLIEDIKQEKENDNHPVIDSLVSLGFSPEIAKKYKNKHGVKKIERNIAYTLAKKQECQTALKTFQ
jgi:plasmid replication initiation protein